MTNSGHLPILPTHLLAESSKNSFKFPEVHVSLAHILHYFVLTSSSSDVTSYLGCVWALERSRNIRVLSERRWLVLLFTSPITLKPNSNAGCWLFLIPMRWVAVTFVSVVIMNIMVIYNNLTR